MSLKIADREFLTTKEIAKLLAIDNSTVGEWRMHRGLPGHKIGGRWFYERAKFMEWLNIAE